MQHNNLDENLSQCSMHQIEDLKGRLKGSSQNVVITIHQKADADALGSSLALYLYLRKLGHQVHVISPTDYPRFLHWMPAHHCVINYEENEASKSLAGTLLAKADIIFCLDFSNFERLKDLCGLVEKCQAFRVLIDHHLDPSMPADFVYWDPGAAATCQLIYRLILDLGDKSLIDISMGECLYAGIMTDTGSFRFPSTSKEVHLIIADLLDIGVDNFKVHRLVYDNNSEERLRFLGFALSTKLQILAEYHTAYIVITNKELKQFHAQTGDTEGWVNYALSIEGIVFAAIIIEREDAVKLSFRSIGNFKVNQFAQDHFQGGGHKNAAGGKSDKSLQETLDKFLSLLPQYKEEIYKEVRKTENLIPC